MFNNLNRRKKQEMRSDEQPKEEKVDVSDPKIQEIQKNTVQQIAQLVLQLCALQVDETYSYQDIDALCSDYSPHFQALIAQMLNPSKQNRSNFPEVILSLDQIKRTVQFAACFDTQQKEQISQSKE